MAVTVASVLPNDIPAALERIRTVNCSPLAGTYVWRVELWIWSVICLHFLQEMAVPISWSLQGQLMKSGIGWKPFCAVGDFVTSRVALFKGRCVLLVVHAYKYEVHSTYFLSIVAWLFLTSFPGYPSAAHYVNEKLGRRLGMRLRNLQWVLYMDYLRHYIP